MDVALVTDAVVAPVSGMRIGYARVSTDEQSDSGAGLDAQTASITTECARRDCALLEVFTDRSASGRSLDGREGLAAALEMIEAPQADVLVVAKLDRLSRSLLDFAGIMGRVIFRRDAQRVNSACRCTY